MVHIPDDIDIPAGSVGPLAWADPEEPLVVVCPKHSRTLFEFCPLDHCILIVEGGARFVFGIDTPEAFGTGGWTW